MKLHSIVFFQFYSFVMAFLYSSTNLFLQQNWFQKNKRAKQPNKDDILKYLKKIMFGNCWAVSKDSSIRMWLSLYCVVIKPFEHECLHNNNLASIKVYVEFRDDKVFLHSHTHAYFDYSEK